MSELKTIEELKIEADQLGVTYRADITQEKLAAKIEAHYAKSENESKVTVNESSTEEQIEPDEALANASSFQRYVQEQKREALKTRIVTIIDNDSRVNNVTTTCTVSSSNEFFDLGTVILPLNERVEVRQGHLNVLSELKIPQHVKSQVDPSISKMVLRPRYTIQYDQA